VLQTPENLPSKGKIDLEGINPAKQGSCFINATSPHLREKYAGLFSDSEPIREKRMLVWFRKIDWRFCGNTIEIAEGHRDTFGALAAGIAGLRTPEPPITEGTPSIF
jgi:hypothetical protein